MAVNKLEMYFVRLTICRTTFHLLFTLCGNRDDIYFCYLAEEFNNAKLVSYRKWQDYVYIQCEYKSTKQKIKHLLREENKVKENKIS